VNHFEVAAKWVIHYTVWLYWIRRRHEARNDRRL